MNKLSMLRLGGTFMALATAFGVGLAVGQQTPPTENQGVAVKNVGSLELGPEIEGMAGRQLRFRVITLEPGGVFAVHNHKDRPTVEYLLKGEVTEFRGETSKVYHDGDGVLSDRNTTHWWRNDGAAQAIFIAADVFHPPK
jgi:quercetin dioxygenase-like cupin family protein